MGNIFYLMGKSASGKDSFYKSLKEIFPELRTVTLYTTRPNRGDEREGEVYYFVDEKRLQNLQSEGRVIELRAYNTACGVWKYFTVDDGQFDQEEADYLMIGTLESYEKMQQYFGKDRVVPLYIEVEDGERLNRALVRERSQKVPRYAEMCRRFLADTEDFAEENLRRLGISERFENIQFEETLRKISERIRRERKNLG